MFPSSCFNHSPVRRSVADAERSVRDDGNDDEEDDEENCDNECDKKGEKVEGANEGSARNRGADIAGAGHDVTGTSGVEVISILLLLLPVNLSLPAV